ncbi:MAG: helix-hairpin-helix domain-containing protein [Candidatus Marinimicrobia bacterium]|nr:helix-hairpin-helix domain-containing protein [Candidatus Neomarinimicrobiota bacterium]
MKFFTPSEERLLKFLGVLFMIGLLAREIRGYLERPTPAEQAERAADLEAFHAGGPAYLATGDGATLPPNVLAISAPIDVNRADNEQLQQLHGIGPVLAKKIIDYRTKNGYFQTIQDLTYVHGIGPRLLARWEGLLTAQADTTVQKGVSIE